MLKILFAVGLSTISLAVGLVWMASCYIGDVVDKEFLEGGT